jgi:hypothetical protein
MAADDGGLEVVDEVEATIRQAAGKKTVTKIRIAIGKEVSVSSVKIASELHRRFNGASVTLEKSAITDSVVVKDIEVE